MTVSLEKTYPSLGSQQLETPALQALGSMGIAERLTPALMMIEVNGTTYATDLPAGLNPFEDTERVGAKVMHQPFGPSLSPTKLDSLPVGDHQVYRLYQSKRDRVTRPAPEPIRTISVLQTVKGKAIDLSSVPLRDHPSKRGNPGVMRALGYELSNHNISVTAFPTPETVVSAAAELGVTVCLISEYAKVPDPIYLRAFADGEYPVSTANAQYYRHDIDDDHLTAMVLGGKPLKEALKTAAAAALATGDEKAMEYCAGGIDVLTDFLGVAVGAVPKPSYIPTVLETAASLGISPAVTNQILKTAQSNWDKFNLANLDAS